MRGDSRVGGESVAESTHELPVGDVQGCDDALGRLLAEIGFSPSRDHIVVLGDLVNRGPDSLARAAAAARNGRSATCLLGNHDLHLLASTRGSKAKAGAIRWARSSMSPIGKPGSTGCVIAAWPACDGGWLCVHAGVIPQWDAADVLARAGEVEALLRSELGGFLAEMYGDSPVRWSDALQRPRAHPASSSTC